MPELFKVGHALLIGVGADLGFTIDDAWGLAKILKDPDRCAYPTNQVKLLTGEDASRQAILDSLDRLAFEADQSSTVIIYFSGHGYRVNAAKSTSNFLVPFGAQIDRLRDTAISGSEFANRLKSIRSKHLLLLLDCCHAGRVGLAEGIELSNVSCPPEVQKLIEQRGRMIIASGKDDELSYGGKIYSAFALALIEAFSGKCTLQRDGFVRSVDLAKYVEDIVASRTEGKQHPIFHFDETDNFQISYYSGGDKNPKDLAFDAQSSSIIISDKAASIDLLGYKKFTDPLAKRINQLDARDTPLTIGIFGEWGSGKTSFLEMIRESLMNNYNINSLVFNAWKYENEENLWSALVQSILNHAEVSGTRYERLKLKLKLWWMTVNLSSGMSEIAKNILYTILKISILIFLLSIFIIIILPIISTYSSSSNLTSWNLTSMNLNPSEVALIRGSGISALLLGFIIILVNLKVETIFDLFKSNLNFDFSKFSNSMSYQERISFYDKLSVEFRKIIALVNGKKPVVIIIDDLDRCLPNKALQVLEGIKLFLDMEYCVYLFALDRDIIEKIVHIKYENLKLSDDELKKLRENYIEKLIQVSIPIPPVDDDRFKEFVRILYLRYDDKYGEYISDIFAEALPHNPRKIKHIIQYYLICRESADMMIREGKVCPVLLAKIVIIQSQFREVYNAIIKNNILLRALELTSLGKQLQLKDNEDKKIEEIFPLVKTKAEKFLDDYPQLKILLGKVEEGEMFDKCDIDSYIFLLRKLPPVIIREDEIVIPEREVSQAYQRIETESVGVSIPRQIPMPPQDFTGRDTEISDIMNYFDHGGTIALLQGTGGVGKTALALVLADRLKSKFANGQIFLDLNGTSEEPLTTNEAMVQVIRAFSPMVMLPESENEIAGLYHSILAGKHAILLLDNAKDREQVEPLIPPRDCAVIITSRRIFTTPGMPRTYLLDALKPSDASELIIKICPRIKENANELARLCGYLPLALRAAASFIAVESDLKPERYIEDLQSELTRLEKIGEAGVVEASFNMSYTRLDDKSKLVFRLLSVFPSDFDANAEEDVCQDPEHRHLSDLVRWSLVDFNSSEERYRLQDLARLFAIARSEADASYEARRRHALHYRDVLSASSKLYIKGGEGILAGLRLFDREEANIRAGQAWAAQNIQNDSLAAQICMSYPDAGVYVLDLRLHPREMISWLEAALSAARQLKDRSMESAHLGNLGLAYSNLGDARKAIEFYEQHLAIAHEIGDRRGEGAELGNLGSAYVALGDARKALEYYGQALAIDREVGDRRGEGTWLGNMGNAYADLGDAHKAIEFYEQHLAIAREIGDRRGEENALGNLGIAYKNLGEPRKAIEFYEQHLAIAREIGDRRGEENALGNLGNAYADLGDAHKAIKFYEQALKISREIGDKRSEGAWLGNMGLAYMTSGDAHKAIEFYEQALKISREIGDRRGEANTSWNLGLIYEKTGNLEQAVDLMQVRVKFERDIGHPDADKDANYLNNLRAKIQTK